MRCFVPLFLALGACGGGDGGGFEVTDQPLQGVIGGQAWTFADGETDSFLSDEEQFFAVLFAESYDACVSLEPEGPQLIVAIPTTPGTYEFSSMLNMTFVPSAGENLITGNGGVIVDEVTDTTVTGGLYGKFDDDNEVDGNFTLTICTE